MKMANREGKPGAPDSSSFVPHSAFRTPHSRKRGWRLAREGGYWLLPMALLIGVGIGKNINLVLLGAELGPAADVVVLPALGDLHRGRLRHQLRCTGQGKRSRQQPRHHRAAQAEFHGLRPFTTGDSPRTIHWRTSARRGELMV